MKRNIVNAIIFAAVCFLLVSCAARKPRVEEPMFSPVDVSQKLQSGEYVQKVDNFMVILDASQSMSDMYNGRTKFSIAKEVVARMYQTLPDIKINSALRTFGHGFCLPQKKTLLINDVRERGKAEMEAGLAEVACDGGNSPLAPAIEEAMVDLQATTGNIALIIVSDGEDMLIDKAADAAKIKQKYGERICIYPVLVGASVSGEKLMRRISEIGECGFFANADDILSPQGMAGFVEKVFFAKDSDFDGVADYLDKCPNTVKGVSVDAKGCPLDSDGDGVADYLDKCPNTPRGVAVNAQGCGLDSDGDGVPDSLDNCPGTPAGVAVNKEGCPLIYANVGFDLDKSDIKPGLYPLLNTIAADLKNNPGWKVRFDGHACDLGTEQYNLKLSERRAIAVKNYLVDKGIDAGRISIKAFGESAPLVPNVSEANRAKNRRVEFTIMR